MTAELERVQERDAWIPVVKEVAELAKQLASTPFVGAFRGKPGDVFGAILYGHELHLAPLQALQALDSIDGKPTLKAEALRALFFRDGHRLEIVEWTDKKCTVRAERKDGLSSVEATYTLADAQTAGLAGKKNWRTAPKAMLYARATSMAIKAVAPDIALGIEVGDGPDDQVRPVSGAATVVQLDPRPSTDEVLGAVVLPDGLSVDQYMDRVRGREPQEGTSEPVTVQVDERPTSGPGTAMQPPVPAPEPMVTKAQLAKMNAQLGDLERLDGKRLTRDERREMIRALAGVEELVSANDLTKGQASVAIEALDRLLDSARDAAPVDAEVVDEEVPRG